MRASGNSQADEALQLRRIAGEFRRGRAVNDAAALEDQRVRGVREGDLDVLLDQDGRGALVFDHFPQRNDKLFNDDRRKALERLVEEEQFWIGHQGARDRQHLLLAARELVAHVDAALGEAREERVDRGEAPAPGTRGDAQVLFYRERGEDLAFLRDPAEAQAGAAMRGELGDVLAAPEYL